MKRRRILLSPAIAAIMRAMLIAILSSCALFSAAQAANVGYDVAIDAPAPLKALLEDNLDIVRWRGNARIDAEQLQRLYRAAPEQIQTLVATEGFYSPVITPRLVKPAQDGGPWHVQLTVAPGAPARVGKINLELRGFGASKAAGDAKELDNTPFDTTAIRAAWPLTVGQIFRQADWEAAKRSVLRQAMLVRYPRANLVETNATVDADTGLATLLVVLDSGPAVRFGPLRVSGTQRYPARIVTDLNPVREGEIYDEAKLLTLQTRLQESGYYAGVDISTDFDAAGAQSEAQTELATGRIVTAPLSVKVTENRRRKAAVGLGYSTNTGNRAQVSYEDLSFLGLRLNSNVTLETKKQAARADLFFPVGPNGYSDSIGTSVEHSTVAGEVTGVASIAAKRSWGSPALERNLTLEFLTEQQRVVGQDTNYSRSLPLTYGITLRRVDSLIFPTRGYALSAQLGGTPLRLLTDEPFVRGAVKLIDYIPFGKNGTVVLRGEFGALASKNKVGVPSTYLFRAGGDQSVRGYAYQQLGLRDGDAIIGGRYLATGSFEYQHWFLPTWGAAVFYDAGNAADSLKDLTPKSGYGVGARWKSPVGPINADIAYGHAVQQYRLHFSLGFTF